MTIDKVTLPQSGIEIDRMMYHQLMITGQLAAFDQLCIELMAHVEHVESAYEALRPLCGGAATMVKTRGPVVSRASRPGGEELGYRR